MAKKGRRPALDDRKKGDIVAILSVGCSRKTAARYVGCSVRTIANTARRDPAFAEALAQAESRLEIKLMKNIGSAAEKAQYWRAAAWALERRNPDDYAPRPRNVVTWEQVRQLLDLLADVVVEEVPVARFRKNILKRFDSLATGWPASQAAKVTPDVQDNGQ